MRYFDGTTAKATEGRDSIIFSVNVTFLKLGPFIFAPILVLCVRVYIYNDTFDEHLLLLLLLQQLFLIVRFDHLKMRFEFLLKSKTYSKIYFN